MNAQATAPKSGTGWRWVLLAGLFEVGFTYALKMEQRDPRYLTMFIVFAVISFECLARALKTLPLGTAYAVWTGIGSVGTILLGAVLFGESVTPLRLTLLGLLVASLVGLKLLGQTGTQTEAEPPALSRDG